MLVGPAHKRIASWHPVQHSSAPSARRLPAPVQAMRSPLSRHLRASPRRRQPGGSHSSRIAAWWGTHACRPEHSSSPREAAALLLLNSPSRLIAASQLTLPRPLTLLPRHSWAPVGARGGASPAAARLVSLALDATGAPVCAFDDASTGRKLTVTRFDAATGKWSPLGQPGLTVGAVAAVDLKASPARRLYV